MKSGAPLFAGVVPEHNADDCPEIILWAGDIVVPHKPSCLTTVLGSCVSACLYDKELRLGGMNHFLVPDGGESGKHGAWSMEELVSRLMAAGARSGHLKAKLFGGSNPLSLVHRASAVGPANVAIARSVLASHSIPVVSESVGHNVGMRLFFLTWTGDVWLRKHEGKTPA